MVNEDNIKNVIICLASAGSGKTTRISGRFLELLKKNPLNSIVAITFTKKAAAEMRERVISTLKNVILKKELNSSISLEDGFKMLKTILENYSEFQITTIDSFMNKIFKAFSIEFNVSPDYEIIFENDEIFELSLNELLNSGDERVKKIVLFFLKSLLKVERDGFDPIKILKNGLKKFDTTEINMKLENITSKTKRVDFEDLILSIESSLLEKYFNGSGAGHRKFECVLEEKFNELKERVLECEEFLNKNKTRWRNREFREINKDLAFIYYSDGWELFKKNKGQDREECHKFVEIFNNFVSIFRDYLMLKKFQEGLYSFEVLKMEKKIEENLRRDLNVVYGDSIAGRIREKLKEENGVSYAFLKIGVDIKHYMIDEFQDTSISQFEAMTPLLEEASSNYDSSLFVVGDKKQAIYGWREGDYRVFDKLKDIVPHANLKELKLETNYRSHREIVEFNNMIFERLKNLKNSKNFQKYFKNDDFYGDFLKEINSVYLNVKQKNHKKVLGYVSVKLFEKGKNESVDIEEDVIKADFFKLLGDLLERYNPGDILILGRNKDDIEKIVYWTILYQREYKNKFPFITEESLKIFSNDTIKNLLAFTSYLISKDEFFQKGLKENKFPLEFDKVAKFLNSLSPYEFFVKILDDFSEKIDFNRDGAYIESFLEEVLSLSNDGYGIEEVVEYFYKKRDISLLLPEGNFGMRIMTIHKAKGLEAKVVLIPLYSWQIKKHSFVNFIEYTPENFSFHNGEDVKAFIKLGRDVSKLDKEFKKEYENLAVRELIENINLMYVANTRAKEELYIRGAFTEGRLNSGYLLYELLSDDFNISHSEGEGVTVYEYTSGKKCGGRDFPVKKSEARPFRVTFNDIRNGLRIEENQIFKLEDESLFGNIFHFAISHINQFGDLEDLKNRVRETILKTNSFFKIKDTSKLESSLLKTLTDLKFYFRDFDWAFNEKSFVSRKGKIFRVDRILSKNGRIYVIDYKTGKEKEGHISQIKMYKEALSDMGNITGILYYIKNEKVINV